MTPNPSRLIHPAFRIPLQFFLALIFTVAARGIVSAQDSTYTVHLPLVVQQAAENSQANSQAAGAPDNTYTNPLPITTPSGMTVESCADPAVIREANPAPPDQAVWYMACTTDPLSGSDRDADGNLIFHLIPLFRSTDLIHWAYVGDAFATRPDWVADDAGLWAPTMEYYNDQYYLYFTASNTDLPGGGSAIGVATAPTPAGPWVDTGIPAVEPHAPDCCPGDKRWTFDPSIIADDSGQRYIYYGSYFGGISVRKLSADGLTSDPASQTPIAIANRYEGAFVLKRAGFYYLFASATDCCRGPLTGYSVFVGRSASPLGPFADAEGVSLLAGRVGGTTVLSMNGNRWVGPGHNAIVTDLAGQDWILYHAVDRNDPYFAGAVGFTKRPALIDPVDWIQGWPVVRGGRWASSTPQVGPVTGPGDLKRTQQHPLWIHLPRNKYDQYSYEFDGTRPRGDWHWVREPEAGTYGLEGGTLRFDTQAGDIYQDSNNASILAESAPAGDYLVETRVKLNVPPEGCCYNYVQAGLVIFSDDDNFIKLTHVSIWETRQTEFAKEVWPVTEGYPRYGNTVIGAPGEWTYLRIARHACGDEECYTGYTSRDGRIWLWGGTWTQKFGADAKIGLVSMGGTGFTANFDYVRTFRLDPSSNPD